MVIFGIGFLISMNRINNISIDNKSNIIEVSGEANIEVIADTVILNVNFENNGKDLSELYVKNQSDKKIVVDFLKKYAIEPKDFEISDYTHHTMHHEKKESIFKTGSSIKIKTNNIDAIQKIKSNLKELYDQKIYITHNDVELECSKLQDIQNDLCLLAIKNAEKQAQLIAASQKMKITTMKKVQSVAFSPYSTSSMFFPKAERCYSGTNTQHDSDKLNIRKKIYASVKIEFDATQI